jgi:glycine/D-amino acid oxidase-like deaminating enzyme
MSRIDTSILPERPVTMSRIETDICIIGAGSGGLSVAAGAVQMGAKVVLIEGHKMGGRLPQLRLRAVQGAAGGGPQGA